jgi:predicted metal-binding membrane protein
VPVTVATSNGLGPGAFATLVSRGGRAAIVRILLPLLAVSGVAWVLTVRAGTGSTGMSAAAFVTAWTVMMAAMMLPAVAPVVALYGLAAQRRLVAAVPYFAGGYLLVWVASAGPAYVVARTVDDPLMQGERWMQRIVGAMLLVAGAFELTPLKAICLRRCRTPLSFFLARSGSLRRPSAAFRAGVRHGTYCLGCCWALMAVLVVLGGMQLAWAIALAVVITLEKLAPRTTWLVRGLAAAAVVLGTAIVVSPGIVAHLTTAPSMSGSM